MPANQYISDNELFHFIGRGLKSDEDRFMLLSDTILDKESLRHPPFSDEGGAPKRIVSRTMDGRWLGSLRSEAHTDDPSIPIFENIVCFADIPFASLGLHASKYSKFGLSFGKYFIAERGGRPVMYFPIWEHESFRSLAGINTLSRIDARLREFMEGEYDQYEQLKRDFVLEFAAYLKPFDISLSLDSPGNYYTEREWRMLGYLNFSISDIKRVIVPPPFVDRLLARYPQLAGRVQSLSE